ncbi:MAG: hypothetical protein D6714_05260 [Bacteroidetes bacterium]|nr:MAG: hypothetical protein D6714_05260 [Bacteroidota bacterium]
MPPLRGSGRVFYSNESRAGKSRETGSLCQSLKTNPTIHFSQKNKIRKNKSRWVNLVRRRVRWFA